MNLRNQLLTAAPYLVEQSVRKLGDNLKTARLRRNLTLEQIAQKIGTSRFVISNAEKGKLTTSVAVYAALLWAYGLIDQFSDLASPEADEEGARLSPKRKHASHPRKLDNDF